MRFIKVQKEIDWKKIFYEIKSNVPRLEKDNCREWRKIEKKMSRKRERKPGFTFELDGNILDPSELIRRVLYFTPTLEQNSLTHIFISL